MITVEEIRRAHHRIQTSILVSPCSRSETFSEMTGNDVFLKLENLQRTGSYKERGALNRILTLTPEERRRGLIAASAGNHAQAVAYHATKLKMRAEICMPLATPLNKVMATRRFGAETILVGANYDEAGRFSRSNGCSTKRPTDRSRTDKSATGCGWRESRWPPRCAPGPRPRRG
jgi:threonine dehydratase